VPQTLNAVFVAAFAIVPGALYTWAFEQQAGRWGATASDRLQRFLGVSSIFLVAELPLLYELYRQFGASGVLMRGEALPGWAWFIPTALVAIPLALGQVIGRAAHGRKRWVRFLTGPSPAPRAWDDLFASPSLTGWLILRLRDGSWAGGLWGISDTNGLRSYAAGYPEAQDLLISDLAEVDTDGEMLLDPAGHPILTGVSLLVRWDEVAYARFTPA